MECALNLLCLLLVGASVLGWTVWRRSSKSILVPQLGFGFVVIACVLVLILPAISISDDLAQAPLEPEGLNTQDKLRPPLALTQLLAPAISICLFCCPLLIVAWEKRLHSPQAFAEILLWTPNIEKRPPPLSAS